MTADPSTASSASGATPSVTRSRTRRIHEACTHFANALLGVVLAPECAGCARLLEQPLDGPVCPACWAGIRRLTPPFCRTCGVMLPSWRVLDPPRAMCPACRRRPYSSLDLSRSAGDYDGTLREIIHAFKYEGRRTLASPLGALMREGAGDLLDGASCVVPVPLHPWRRLHRGFNQAADLADALDLPIIHALWRQRLTSPQSGLTAGARRRNVRGAFRLSPLLSRQVRAMVVDRVVVLVDDVRTTGATLDACAHVLKDAGACQVRALTVARAELPAVAKAPATSGVRLPWPPERMGRGGGSRTIQNEGR